MPRTFVKDPDAIIDYEIDWGPYLAWSSPNDAISTSVWEAETGLSLQSSGNDATTATATVSGGTVGQNYYLRNRITTTGGRTDDRTLKIKIRER